MELATARKRGGAEVEPCVSMVMDLRWNVKLNGTSAWDCAKSASFKNSMVQTRREPLGILDVNSDRTEHVDHAEPGTVLDGLGDQAWLGVVDVRKRQGSWNGEDGQVHHGPVCEGYR